MTEFTWIPIYREIAEKLKSYYSNRTELVQIIVRMRQAGLKTIALEDKSDFETFPLKDIDPFTFYSNFNRGITDENRKAILEKLKEEWALKSEIPSDFSGIPVMNNQSAWFIAYERERDESDIDNFWKLFMQVLDNKIEEEQFNAVLGIRGIKNNITIALFWINPEKYLNLDKVNRKFLDAYGIDTNFTNYKEYIDILNKVNEKIKKKFYELSREAWLETRKTPLANRAAHTNGLTSKTESDVRFWIYAPGPNARFWEDCQKNKVMLYGADDLPRLDSFKTREEITAKFQELINDDVKHKNYSLGCWQFVNEVKKGDIVIAKKGTKTYLGYGIVSGTYFYDTSRKTYKNAVPVEWKKTGEWEEDRAPIVQKTLTDITRYTDYVRRLVKLIGIEMNNTTLPAYEEEIPLNVIYYGPPGTGKTYMISNELMEVFTTREELKTREDFANEIIENMSWWQVITLVMLDLKEAKVPEMVRHPFMRLKAELSNNKFVNAAIWAHLQAHTKADCANVNYTNRVEPFLFVKDENSLWSIDLQATEREMPELIKIKNDYDNYSPIERKDERFRFITFHQSYSYEDFIEGIKPVLEDGQEQSDVKYRIEDGIFKRLVKKAQQNPDKKYALFIDEINRGNIAGIFGELISLIEEDKRLGEEHELKVILPYSKEEFTVPANVHIIGTMNTADRSIEALDTALRRRFTFIEKKPEPALLSEDDYICQGISLESMLTAINKRLEILLDKDHLIGHSYFMGIKNRENPLKELREIFSKKIVPLLNEYFYGDCGKIKMILGPAFVTEKEISDSVDNSSLFPLQSDENADILKQKILYNISIPESLEGFKKLYATQA